MTNITEVRFIPGYNGSQPTIKVFTREKNPFILETKEAAKIIMNRLNQGNTTTLKPQQRIYRIIPT